MADLTSLKFLQVVSNEFDTCCKRNDVENARAMHQIMLNLIEKDLAAQASDPHFIAHLMNEMEKGDGMAELLLYYFKYRGLLKWIPKK